MSNHLIAGIFLMGSLTASAQSIPQVPGSTRTPIAAPDRASRHASPITPATKNPYAQLFPLVPAPQTPSALAPAAQPRRKTICGLTVWNVTPELDPRSVVRSGNPQVDYKIGKLAPPVCTD